MALAKSDRQPTSAWFMAARYKPCTVNGSEIDLLNHGISPSSGKSQDKRRGPRDVHEP